MYPFKTLVVSREGSGIWIILDSSDMKAHLIKVSAPITMAQIWTALIAILLLKYMMFRSQFGWSLSNLIAMLRYNLFTYRNLWEWIDSPYEVPPLVPSGEQVLST